jgi:HEAT repeat protein
LEARPFLLNSLKDKDSAVCCAAIEALTMLDEAADLGPLEKLLGDPDARVRRKAVIALHVLSAGTLVDPLVRMLKDPDLDVRCAASWALGLVACDKAVDSLMDNYDKCTIQTKKMLRDMYGKNMPDDDKDARLRAARLFVRRREFKEAAQMGDHAIAPLLAWLNDGVTGDGPKVVDALASMHAVRDAVVLHLADRLYVDDFIARSGALVALERMGGSAVGHLIAKLDDLRDDVRSGAVEALFRIGGASVVALSEAFDICGAGAKCSIAKALGCIGDPYAVASLVKGLTNNNAAVRRCAAVALGKIGRSCAVPPMDALASMTALLEDGCGFVANAAKNAIGAIHKKQAAGTPVTVVYAKVDVGHGHTMHIRGTAPLPGWDRGIPMYNFSGDEWIWASGKNCGPFEYKLLLDDKDWELLDENANRQGTQGMLDTVCPVFAVS